MLTVRDIMNPVVVTVGPDSTVRQLARVLADGGISGAPVVDGEGALVGVVSATDLVRLAADDGDVHIAAAALPTDRADLPDPSPEEEEEEADPYGFFLPEDSPFAGAGLLELFTESELDEVTVGDIMTQVAFSVRPDDTVQELADFLVRGGIHRAVVTQHDRLLGIVTAGDVLKAVADGRLK